MGKKGKGNKLAKMSEEERVRYLQLRADIEEEARRRKVQLIALYMKNKLKREEAFCRLNTAKINQEWRSILRQIKCKEMHKEMEEMAKFCNVALERKSRIIARLQNDLEQAEDMYSKMQQAHIQTVNRFINIQKQRIEFLKDNYEKQKDDILDDFNVGFKDFLVSFDKAQKELECVSFHLEEESEAKATQQKENFLDRLNDVKNELQLRLDDITQSGEAKLESLWLDYQNVLSDYVKRTEGFYAEYMDLKERDEENTALIRDNCYEIERITNYLAELKLSAAEKEDKQNAEVAYLQKTRDELNKRLTEMKIKLDEDLKKYEEQFSILSVEGHNAMKAVEKIVEQGESIMKIVNACSRLETESESLRMCSLPPVSDRQMQLKSMEAASEGNQDTFRELLQMEKFWKRVNNAEIDVVCLREKKKTLQEENARLKIDLQEHLMNLNLSNGSNEHVNDYLAKRPSSVLVGQANPMEFGNPNSAESKSRRRPTTSYVEANFTSAVRSKELVKGKPKLPRIRVINNW